MRWSWHSEGGPGIGKGSSGWIFWADNPKLEDPIDLAVSGDSAPNRRFSYRDIRE
jgi:hypothetical protein